MSNYSEDSTQTVRLPDTAVPKPTGPKHSAGHTTTDFPPTHKPDLRPGYGGDVPPET